MNMIPWVPPADLGQIWLCMFLDLPHPHRKFWCTWPLIRNLGLGRWRTRQSFFFVPSPPLYRLIHLTHRFPNPSFWPMNILRLCHPQNRPEVSKDYGWRAPISIPLQRMKMILKKDQVRWLTPIEGTRIPSKTTLQILIGKSYFAKQWFILIEY